MSRNAKVTINSLPNLFRHFSYFAPKNPLLDPHCTGFTIALRLPSRSLPKQTTLH